MAVRRRLCAQRRANVPLRSAAVVHDDLVTPLLRELRGEYPGEAVRAAAWRERNDEAHRTVGKTLRQRRAGHSGQQYGDRDSGQVFHFPSPEIKTYSKSETGINRR